MKQIESEFKTNANGTGLQTFLMVLHGTNPEGNNVYIYQRTTEDNKPYGFEVFIPNIKKAGTYPLPGGKEITYPEDFEEYPGASLFGKKAWSCLTLERAKEHFERLMCKGAAEVDEEEPEKDALSVSSEVIFNPSSPKKQKGMKPILIYPVGEFSVKDLAETNKVDYPIAFIFVKESISTGKIKETRKERRNVKGKETQLYAKA